MRKINPILRLLFIGVVPLVTIVYGLWYFFSDYKQLVEWYKNLNPYFYKSTTWKSFFTESIKSQGNWWCIAAIIAVFIWTFIAIKTPQPVFPKFRINKKSFITYFTIVIGGTILSLIAMRHSLYASDEVFSAVNFASLPAFQRISYYILPNNHLLYNFINGCFFGFDDMVQTGRLISMLCYIGVLCSTWYYLKKWVDNIWLRIAILLFVAVQLPVWGFSAQARGYEMVLLCSIVSFISFWSYWVEKKRYYLIIHSTSLVAGMLTMPSFLYWWAGLLIAATAFQVSNRQFDKVYLKAMLASFCLTLVLFLPALSFSGLSAFADNGYVKGSSESTWHFFTHLNASGYFNGLFNEWFYSGNLCIGIACLLIPLLIFLYCKNDQRFFTTGIMYLSLITAFIFMVVIMKRLPFYRNLIANDYLIILLAAISLCSILKANSMKIIYAIILLIAAGYSLNTNYKRKEDTLYYYNVRETIDKLEACKIQFEANRTIYLDDECFYWWYMLKNNHNIETKNIHINRASFKTQDYCIMPKTSLPPVSDTLIYRRMAKCGEFDVYKK